MEPLAILFGAIFTSGACHAAGTLLLRDTSRDPALRFVTGSCILSLLVFALCALHCAYPLLFLALGTALLVAEPPRFPRPRAHWWLLPFAAFFVLYLCNAMAPEISPDGSGYHLGLVARYLREHGFVPITDNLYAALPAAVEMLFLFAFAFGRHSAAALVHLTFLLALAWQIFSYARHRGVPLAGTLAAFLVFASPVVGIDAASAYIDVALAAIAFTLFYLLQLWDESRSPRLLLAVGLMAGFAFSAKYTAWPAIAYTTGFILLKQRKAVIPVLAAAAVPVVPWLLKNWIYLQNPLAPFYNREFPNPYVTVAFEASYRKMLAMYMLHSRWEIPMQVTTYGSISGLLGPVFLLAPLALLALRRREGRQLLLAALVFSLTYFSNIATRFLLPPLPFLALACTLALSAVPQLAIAIAVLHAVLSWPAVIPRYSHLDAWRLTRIPWREALRLRPAADFLNLRLIHYPIDRLIEQRTAPGSTVFTFVPIPEAYTSRHIRVEYQSAANQIAGKILWAGLAPEYAPTWNLRLAFPRQELYGVRIVQTAEAPAETPSEMWSIHELRLFDGARELKRASSWRLHAEPYPWTIQDAFDNSLATFWMCGETLRPGQFVQVEFHASLALESVLMESAPNQWSARFQLQGLDSSGGWHSLAASPTTAEVSPPLGLRRAITAELKRRGIDYLLVFDTDLGASQLRQHTAAWGLTLAGQSAQAALYRIEP